MKLCIPNPTTSSLMLSIHGAGLVQMNEVHGHGTLLVDLLNHHYVMPISSETSPPPWNSLFSTFLRYSSLTQCPLQLNCKCEFFRLPPKKRTKK